MAHAPGDQQADQRRGPLRRRRRRVLARAGAGSSSTSSSACRPSATRTCSASPSSGPLRGARSALPPCGLGDRLGRRLRAEAQHAVPVVRTGHARRARGARSRCCATPRAASAASTIRWHDPDGNGGRGHRRRGRPPHRRGDRARLARRRDVPGVVGALRPRRVARRARSRGARPADDGVRRDPSASTRCCRGPTSRRGCTATSCGTTGRRRCGRGASRTAAGPRATTAARARPAGLEHVVAAAAPPAGGEQGTGQDLDLRAGGPVRRRTRRDASVIPALPSGCACGSPSSAGSGSQSQRDLARMGARLAPRRAARSRASAGLLAAPALELRARRCPTGCASLAEYLDLRRGPDASATSRREPSDAGRRTPEMALSWPALSDAAARGDRRHGRRRPARWCGVARCKRQ